MDRLIRRALTLEERLADWKAAPASCPVPTDPAAAERVASYKRWFETTTGGATRWAGFLADLGITESTLVDLARSTGGLALRPAWAETLEKLFAALEHSEPSRSRGAGEQLIAMPVVEFAWRELLLRLPPHQLGLLSNSALAQLRGCLGARLARSAQQVVAWETELRGEEELFANGVAPATARILQCYTALARLWTIQTINWIDSIAEFLRYAEDFLLARESPHGTKPLRIRSLVPDLSDPHDGNRTVMEVRLSNRERWFFKPRSGRHEAGWFQLLDWLNAEGFSPRFYRPQVFVAEDHCWMEAVSWQTCRRREEVAAYFFRAGALLYLCHLLHGVDFHAGNVVAHGTDPVFVDCETLLHPRTRVPAFAQGQLQGVLRTGLLPMRARDGTPVADVSGFGRRGGGRHQVRLRGDAIAGPEFGEEMAAGFEAMYRFLNRERYRTFADLTRQHLPKEIRHLRRPTIYYGRVLESSVAPAVMADGFERSVMLRAACGVAVVPRRWVTTEVRALENGDVPRLRSKAAGIRNAPSQIAVRRAVQTIKVALARADASTKQ
jgi:hypothetical protein